MALDSEGSRLLLLAVMVTILMALDSEGSRLLLLAVMVMILMALDSVWLRFCMAPDLNCLVKNQLAWGLNCSD